MINKKTTKNIRVYAHVKVAKALESAAAGMRPKVSSSSLGAEIITEWLVQNGYLKTVSVEVPDLD
jgi:hypothetical protein